jgi:hypothetical protein
MSLTAAELIAFARSLEGEILRTRRGKPFQVSVVSGRIVYTRIGNDGETSLRPEGASALDRTVALYHDTGSLTTTDYQAFSVNASYTLTLIDLYQRRERHDQ